MRSRLPDLVTLKSRGIVGENNQGYLEFVGGAQDKQAVVAAENKDRRLVYEGIARRQGTSPNLVGQRRALQIEANSAAGEYVQDKSGKWYRK